MQEEKYIKSFDGELIYAKEYTCPNPIGLIIITTNVKEYSGLYEDFALNLLEKNYNVFTYDLRAHKNSAKEPFGTYSGNFFNDCVRDLIYLNKYLSKKYNLPITNIGIGIGGVIATRASEFYHDKCNNVLVGCPYESTNFLNSLLVLYTRFILVFFNKQSEAKWLNKRIFNKFSKKFEDGAYISTNKNYIQKIKEEKFCNFNLSANILNSIFKGMRATFLRKNLVKIDNEQNFLICSGEYDIVTNFTKKTTSLYNKFKKMGINTEKIIFKNCRHNLLNETNDTFVKYLEKFIGENYDN